MKQQKVALLTAGGLAPCLSSAVGGLIERYTEIDPSIEIIGYLNGYKGLLKGNSIPVTKEARESASLFHRYGGSPIGNSRVKLTNIKDCVKRGLVKEGQNPLQVAAEQLVKDGVTILHTIGGDDTNLTAADLAKYLKDNKYSLTVVGLPKTIDNDVYPIKQTLGADTAAEQGALFFENIVSEQSTSSRMLIIHEVMGRHSGWLTAATAREYRKRLKLKSFIPSFNLSMKHLDIDAIYLPEVKIDIKAEIARLKKIMDQKDSVNVFVAEGAGVPEILKIMSEKGEDIPKDAFGHVRLDSINPGKWFSEQFTAELKAEKNLIQKSGYFARSAAANTDDLRLIKSCTDLAVECALRGESGLIGHDEENQNRLRAIEFPRIKGGKPLDMQQPWIVNLFNEIGQPIGPLADNHH